MACGPNSAWNYPSYGGSSTMPNPLINFGLPLFICFDTSKGLRTSGIKLGGGDLISYDYSDSSYADDLYKL